jgi:hypothetical protein
MTIETIISNACKQFIMSNDSGIANKRIAVTDKVWRDLFGLKKPGQTFDDVIAFLISEHNRAAGTPVQPESAAVIQ